MEVQILAEAVELVLRQVVAMADLELSLLDTTQQHYRRNKLWHIMQKF